MAESCVPDGLIPQPWQTEGVWWSNQRPNVYLAWDPGLGKTIAAALIVNETVWNRSNKSEPTPTVHYVCPPSLVQNVQPELDKWLVADAPRPIISPDTRLRNPPRRTPRSILFVDEAHRFMNANTKRTAALFDYARAFERVVLMSGSPLPNSRPRELWAVLRRFAPDVFGTNYWDFAHRFCGPTEEEFYNFEGKQTRWKFDGFSNRREFIARITESFMLRIRKTDPRVSAHLPPRLEELLTVGDGMSSVVSELERKVLEHFTAEDVIEGRVAKAAGLTGGMHLSTYLKHLGPFKVAAVLPYVKYLLSETRENLLLVGRHVDTIALMARHLAAWNPLVITGAVAPQKRTALVQAWQADPARRVAVLNYEGGGIGQNMQKVDRVILFEYSWRDGDNGQAIDRAHRVGRVGTVRAQYVVLKGSIDARRMSRLLDKRRDAV